MAALGYCVAIIKLKTSGCCGCIIYRLLGFPEVILGGVSYWKSTILVICVLKVLNWPYNFLFDVHTLNNLFVPEIKDQILLVLLPTEDTTAKRKGPSIRSVYIILPVTVFYQKRPEALLILEQIVENRKKNKQTNKQTNRSGCEISVCIK